jgi:hypothetical protein
VSCAKCAQTPEDILILTCDHNLCLLCAAKNLQREQKRNMHSFQTVVCELCEIATVLDPASATELLTLLAGQPNTNHTMNGNQSSKMINIVQDEN